jgi:hypothetical protein
MDASGDWTRPLVLGLRHRRDMSAAVVVWYRHARPSPHGSALFAAFRGRRFLYPSVDYFAEAALRTVISSQYAVQAQRHSETLQERLKDARDEIDAMPTLVIEPPSTAVPCEHTERLFRVESNRARGSVRPQPSSSTTPTAFASADLH